MSEFFLRVYICILGSKGVWANSSLNLSCSNNRGGPFLIGCGVKT